MFGVWQKAVTQVIVAHPFFIELLYSVKYKEDHCHQTAATDGRTVYANPEFIKSLALSDQVFVLLHEFLHIILLHPYRRNGRHHQKWGYACDYATNLLLKNMGVTASAALADILLDTQYEGMSAENIYSRIPDPPPEYSSDLIILSQSDKEREKEFNHMKEVVSRVVQQGKALGVIPSALEHILSSGLASPEENWQEHLSRFLQATATGGMSWERVNKRVLQTHKVFAPDNQSRALGKIALFLDASGSCFTTAQQNYFCSHVNAILEDCRPSEVRVYHFDTAIRSVEVFSQGEIDVQLRASGGGGTDFRHIFEEAGADGFVPEAAIVLTDLEGPTGDPPDYPVIWAITTDEVAPFGESVYLRNNL